MDTNLSTYLTSAAHVWASMVIAHNGRTFFVVAASSPKKGVKSFRVTETVVGASCGPVRSEERITVTRETQLRVVRV